MPSSPNGIRASDGLIKVRSDPHTKAPLDPREMSKVERRGPFREKEASVCRSGKTLAFKEIEGIDKANVLINFTPCSDRPIRIEV
jgi:hypothetical protein